MGYEIEKTKPKTSRGFVIENDVDHFLLTEIGAIERETGWKDAYRFDLADGIVEFFDATENALFAVCPIGDLKAEISEIEDYLDELRWDSFEVDYDDGPL